MGGEKTTQAQETTQTTTPQPTAQETELSQLELERQRAVQQPLIETQQQGLGLINALLTGSTELPGFFGEIGRGISPEVTGDIVQESLRDITPSFQSQGILDSGTRASISARTAGDIRRGSAEFNLGNKLNLLNLALSGQAQVQQPLMAQSQLLSSRLAGLRPVTSTGTGSSTLTQMNPFMKSFQQGLGSGFGGKIGGGLAGGLPGFGAGGIFGGG